MEMIRKDCHYLQWGVGVGGWGVGINPFGVVLVGCGAHGSWLPFSGWES